MPLFTNFFSTFFLPVSLVDLAKKIFSLLTTFFRLVYSFAFGKDVNFCLLFFFLILLLLLLFFLVNIGAANSITPQKFSAKFLTTMEIKNVERNFNDRSFIHFKSLYLVFSK